jgi:nucleoid DNA-binding protein
MTKSELIASIAGEAGITKAQAGVALATFVSSLKDSKPAPALKEAVN